METPAHAGMFRITTVEKGNVDRKERETDPTGTSSQACAAASMTSVCLHGPLARMDS